MKFETSSLKQLFSDLDHHAFLFSVLGVVCGLASALIIIVFRLAIEFFQPLLTGNQLEDFESLSLSKQLILPILGFVLMAVYLKLFGKNAFTMGMVHVMDRMKHHQGYFPVRNLLNQFVTGIIAVISGQSSGREGAAVHLGAGISSLMGSRLHLNNHNMKTLVACGSAAAIAASFNTPLAGVVFALEVILLEYKIFSFIPVILASVAGSILSQTVFGEALFFEVHSASLHSFMELPFFLLMAVIIGTASAIAIQISKTSAQFSLNWGIARRFALAAIVTACGIYIAPEIMGLGYDTVSLAMLGELGWKILLLTALVKIVVTSMVIGLGIPSGFIGPSLVMGACLGGSIGIMGAWFSPIGQSDISLYVTIGMAAMMGSLLKAPLAALVAALEFTGNSQVLLPAMMVIVVANLICNDLFKQDSLMETLLNTGNRALKENSLRDWLHNTHVHSLADTRFSQQNRYISFSTAQNLCSQQLNYILISDDRRPVALITQSTLAFHLRFSLSSDNPEEEIDLLAIPGEKRDLAELSSQSSLKDALDTFESKNVHAVYLVNSDNPGGIIFISGVLLKDHVDQYFRS